MIKLDKTATLVFATALSVASVQALAEMPARPSAAGMSEQASPTASSPTAAPMTEGVVRKVDKDARKITLKHGEIVNLQMPGMTMVFQVKDATLLDKVKVGDKVNFTAEKQGGAIVVTAIEVKP